MSNKVITMLAYKRLDYTKQVISALKQCKGFEEYTLLPVIDPGYPEVLTAFESLPKCEIIVNEKRIGGNLSLLQALQRGFDVSDFVIHLEDDTVPGIDSLKYFEWINKTYKENKEIFTATAYSRDINIKPENYFSVHKQRFFTGWMWATWIDRFDEIKKSWNREGELDQAMAFKFLKKRYEIVPYLARSHNIGEHGGVNVTPEQWKRWHYNPVWVNNMPNILFENLNYNETGIITNPMGFK